MATKVHVVPHSHWDREWYLPFEHHRARLIALLDNVLELLGTDEYASYHLDGQMIPVEDYLEVRPQQRTLIEKYVKEGRLKVGPWYVLQDTYLTGSEANVRNLLIGTRMAKEFGGATPIGYLPDAFGNAGQFPQLFAQSGMKAAVFGRGVTLMGRDGQGDPAAHYPRCSEFLWQSPDGSAIPSVYFANWYNNGAEIPTDPTEARAFWTKKLADARRYAATEQLLMMNGCDHQPVQRDLPEALKTARALEPDVEFVHSSLEDYADAMLADLKEPLETVPGELEDHQGDGWNTLRNTASARWYIKAMNRKNETVLEKQAEPMIAMAAAAGEPMDGDLTRYAWKILVQNHPHDSICGCSVDEVHQEMVSRFRRSTQSAEWSLQNAQAALAKHIPSALPEGKVGASFAVFNTAVWPQTAVVSFDAGIRRVYGVPEAREKVEGTLPELHLLGSDGKEIACTLEDLGPVFGYDLPDDRFRQPWYERRVRVTFEAQDVPAFGYDTYLLVEGETKASASSLVVDTHTMENAALRVTVSDNGTCTITDKRTNRTYTGLGLLEDVGDVGNEYIFVEANGGRVTSEDARPTITLAEDTPFRAAFKVEYALSVPAAADSALQDALQAMTPLRERRIARSAEMTDLHVSVTYSLEKSACQLNVRIELDNTAKDHRLRMCFPTDLACGHHYADSVFDLVKRPNAPGPNWINPSRCDRMQLFAAVADEDAGLGIANRGLYEYELLEARNTLAVTLLRSVGELGDWGVFPTPEAQCPGQYAMDLALIPLAGEADVTEGLRLAHLFQTDMTAELLLHAATPALPACKGFINWCGKDLICTAFKLAEDGNGTILRFFNASERSSELTLHTECTAILSSVLEEEGEVLNPAEGKITLPVGGKEIVTLKMKY